MDPSMVYAKPVVDTPANASFTQSGMPSSRFHSAASLVPASPNIYVPLSNGETPEPTPCDGTSSLGGPSTHRPAGAPMSVRSTNTPSLPQPSQHPPVPYPRPSFPPTTNSAASASLPNPGRGEDRDSSIASLLMTTRDAPAEVITGIRYRYMPAISKWNQEEIVLRILHPNRGVAQDSLHAIFAVHILSERDPNRSLNSSSGPGSGARGSGAAPTAAPPVVDPHNIVDYDDDENERFLPALARMFRHNITDVSEEDYFGEAQCQVITEEFAHIYHRMKLPDAAAAGQKRPSFPLLTNRFLVRVPKINIPDEYLAAQKGFFSYRTHDTQEVLFLVEPDVSTCDALGIRFPPINAADARVADLDDQDACGEEPYYPRADATWDKKRFIEVAEAFSHMTYHLSGRSLLVEGLQRTCGYLVDPLVYSKDRKQFGMCNSGLRGLSKWVSRHQCNDVCALLQLPAVKRVADAPNSANSPASAASPTGRDLDGSPLDAYASHLTNFAQSLCSMVILPMHRGQLERSRSPMAASPLPNMSPRRRDRRDAAPAPLAAQTTTAPPSLADTRPPGGAGRHARSPHVGESTAAKASAPPAAAVKSGPHPARLPPRNSITATTASPTKNTNNNSNTTDTVKTAAAAQPTRIRVASPRVTRKGPPPNVLASARAAQNATSATATAASARHTDANKFATARAPAIRSAPADQIAEPSKASTPPASANRSVKTQGRRGTANDNVEVKYFDTDAYEMAGAVLDPPTRDDCSLSVSPATSPNRSKLLQKNADLRGKATAAAGNVSPRGGSNSSHRRTPITDAMSPLSMPATPLKDVAATSRSPKKTPSTRAATATAATSREPPLNTRIGLQSNTRGNAAMAPVSPRPRNVRGTQKPASMPDPALQPMPAAPPAKLPVSARGVTKNLAFVRTPTSRALPFERQPSANAGLVKQRPLSRQATTGSLPTPSDLVTPASNPSVADNNNNVVSPRRGDGGAQPPLGPKNPNMTRMASPFKRTSAGTDGISTTATAAAAASARMTPPPRSGPPRAAPEAFKRSATDMPVRTTDNKFGSPLFFSRNSPPVMRPPFHGDAQVTTPTQKTLVTSAPPLLPTSPSRDKRASHSSPTPPPPPQEPVKPPRSPEVDTLAQTTGGLDIQRQFIFPATKYVYNIEKLEWRRHRALIRICNPEAGVAQGAMRVCFEVNEVSLRGNGNEVAHVAKMFRRTVSNVVEQDYFTEVEMQCLCAEFARNFNNEPVVEENAASNPRVMMNYVTAVVISFDQKDIPEDLWSQRKGFFSYHTSDTDRCMFSMEPMLVGHFTKYNSNFGEAYRHNEKALGEAAAAARYRVFEAAEALSHYSLTKSEGGLLLCDVQGVANELTDPEMHTYDGEGLSIGNMGKRGIDRFAQRHRCNDACRTIGLKSLCMRAPTLTPEIIQSNRYILIMQKMRSTFTKCA